MPAAPLELGAVNPDAMQDDGEFAGDCEGPIHAEEVARRIREAFGLERTGNRILKAISLALRSAEQQGKAILEEGFWSAPERTHPLPRNRRNAALSLRRSDRIAPHEYRLAVLEVVKAAVGIDRKDLIVETARLLGFDRTGADLQAAVDEQISILIKSNRICADNGHIVGSPDPGS